MSLAAFGIAAVLLALERITYALVWHRPQAFAAWSGRRGYADPVDALETLFVAFKALQLAVFVGWCMIHGTGLRWPTGAGPGVLLAGTAAIAIGQYLNASVFRRLGRAGVFYGNRFGQPVPWCTAFPFSVLRHPQYVGTVLSIWGFFLLAAYPEPHWFALPALETLYYAAGALLEHERAPARPDTREAACESHS